MSTPRIVRSRGAARLVVRDAVLSELRSQPRPTDCLFDVLAASLCAFHEQPRILVLGFAAGGVVGPLRAAGCESQVTGVDLDLAGERLFREVCGDWSGPVRVHFGDAAAWLRRRPRRRWDVILEDLSQTTESGTRKPEVCFGELPRLIAAHLAAGGIAVTNVLLGDGAGSPAELARLASPSRAAQRVEFERWDNRLLIRGPGLPSARETSRSLRTILRRIGSAEAERIQVRRCSFPRAQS